MNQYNFYKSHLKAMVLLLVLLQTTILVAQRGNSKEMNKLSLTEQFDYIYKKSSSYQVYKVISKELFLKIKKNTTDSLKFLQNQVENSQKTIDEQSRTIENTNQSLEEANQKIKKLTDEKNSISFLGISFKKGFYNTVLFFIILLLSSLLALFVYKFKNGNQITQKAKKDLNELNDEFEEHRAKSLEREQKVRRELQDFINKSKK